MGTWTFFPLQVKSQDSGIIDYDDFRAELIKNKGRPAIINLNIGTTVKGAVDDLDKVCLSVCRLFSLVMVKPPG